MIILIQIIQKLDQVLFIRIFIFQDQRIVHREDACHRVVFHKGVGDVGLPLQKKRADKQKAKKASQQVPQFVAERRCPVHRDMQGFLCGLCQQFVKCKDQPRKDRQHADHAEECAFRQDDAEVGTDFKTHKDQHQQTYHRGQRTGGDGRECICQSVFHGDRFIRFQCPLLPVPIHQDDGIVHR